MSEHRGFPTAASMWVEYGQPLPFGTYSAEAMFLRSGLAFRQHMVGGGEYEGLTIAAVAGTTKELIAQENGPLVRMHSACTFAEIGDTQDVRNFLGGQYNQHTGLPYIQKKPSQECDCRSQRQAAQKQIANQGGIYFDLLEQEGRGAGLDIKRRAYELQRTEGLDTVQAYERLGQPFDVRRYGHCARFLGELGISRVRLMTNNPRKIKSLVEGGIKVTPVPLVTGVTAGNVDYLRTKRNKAGHILPESLLHLAHNRS